MADSDEGARPSSCGANRAEQSRGTRDRGMTLIEVLVTIVLIGTVVVGILAATQASIIASRTSRDAARVQSALVSAAERVERAGRDDGYTCDLSGPIHAASQLHLGVTAAEAPTYTAIGYEHLTAAGWQSGACPVGSGGQAQYQPNLVQRIRITMTSPETGLSRTLEVLKGDV